MKPARISRTRCAIEPITIASTGRNAADSSALGGSLVNAVIIAGKIGIQIAKHRIRKLPDANSGIE